MRCQCCSVFVSIPLARSRSPTILCIAHWPFRWFYDWTTVEFTEPFVRAHNCLETSGSALIKMKLRKLVRPPWAHRARHCCRQRFMSCRMAFISTTANELSARSRSKSSAYRSISSCFAWEFYGRRRIRGNSKCQQFNAFHQWLENGVKALHNKQKSKRGVEEKIANGEMKFGLNTRPFVSIQWVFNRNKTTSAIIYLFTREKII